MNAQPHLEDTVLMDYVEGRCDDSAAARVRAHLEIGCSRCASELQTWQRIIGALPAGGEPAPPDHVVQRAISLMVVPVERTQPWRQWIAALVADSRRQPMLVGVRDAGSATFRLAYAAEGVRVDLLCERHDRDWRLGGQVQTPEPTTVAWRVSASRTGDAASEARPAASTRANTFGEFHLPPLAPGTYRLTLQTAEGEIILPNLELASP